MPFPPTMSARRPRMSGFSQYIPAPSRPRPRLGPSLTFWSAYSRTSDLRDRCHPEPFTVAADRVQTAAARPTRSWIRLSRQRLRQFRSAIGTICRPAQGRPGVADQAPHVRKSDDLLGFLANQRLAGAVGYSLAQTYVLGLGDQLGSDDAQDGDC